MTGAPPSCDPPPDRLPRARSADRALVELGRIPLWSTPLEAVLRRVADVARAEVPAADAVSITLVDGTAASTAASTGTLAADLDRRQYAEDSGPCLDATRNGAVVSVPDTAGEERYPSFATAAGRAGVLSVLSVGAPVRRRVACGLNVYSSAAAIADDQSVDVVRTCAEYVSTVVNAGLIGSEQQLTEEVQAAMAARAVVEQARGVLMARGGCSPDEALELLTRQSEQTGRTLHDVAADVVDSARTGGAR